MINRSVPVDTVLPHIVYENMAEAIEWLAKTFGFVEHYRYGNPVTGAQMYLGRAYVMLRSSRADSTSPARLGRWTQHLTIFVDDIDAHYGRSKSAGAKIFEEINEPFYGERQYGVEDLDGHRWIFSQHIRDVNPADWGARVSSI